MFPIGYPTPPNTTTMKESIIVRPDQVRPTLVLFDLTPPPAMPAIPGAQTEGHCIRPGCFTPMAFAILRFCETAERLSQERVFFQNKSPGDTTPVEQNAKMYKRLNVSDNTGFISQRTTHPTRCRHLTVKRGKMVRTSCCKIKLIPKRRQ